MQLYTIQHIETDEVLCIAARGINHAAQVFVTFLMARTGSAPGRFDVERVPPSDYAGDFFVENVAADDAAGVIIRQANGSMLFDPVIDDNPMANISTPYCRTAGPFGVYRFTSSAHEPVIAVAANLMAAVSVLHQWRATCSIGEVQFEVEPSWGQRLSHCGRAHLAQAVEHCRQEGILTLYRADIGWTLMTFGEPSDIP